MDKRKFYEEAIESSVKFINKDGKVYYLMPQEIVDYFAEIEEVISACKTVLILSDAKFLTPSQRSFCYYMSKINSLIPLRVINNVRNRFPAWDDRERKKP